MPTLQTVQLTLPLGATEPGSHGMQALSPGRGADVPIVHAVQAVAPASADICPGGHRRHVLLSAAFFKVPGAHALHPPAASGSVPGLQAAGAGDDEA